MRQIKIGTAAMAAIAALAACGNDDANGNANDATINSSSVGADPSESATQRDYQKLSKHTGSSVIEPGRWAVQAAGPDDAPPVDAPLAVFDVPAGFNGEGPWIWTNKAVIGYWNVNGVYAHPCADEVARPVGDTVEDLAAALAAQKVTTTTEPAPVSLGGHDGLYFEMSAPASFDTSTCHEDGNLHVWDDSPGFGAGEVSRHWILDVDGDRVMINLRGDLSTNNETTELFSGIVKSVTFVEAD